MLIYFLIITYQILRRRRERINLIFSGFFISTIIGNSLNMIYYGIEQTFPIPHVVGVILALNFLTNFFFVFGPIFLFIVNMIILESTIIFSVKRQNIYIFVYGIILFSGMLILLLVPDTFLLNEPFLGVDITPEGAPHWGLIFFIYVNFITTIFVVIPIIRSSLKIYFKFENKVLKKKWFFYFIGSLGSFSLWYLISIGNLLDNIDFKLIVGIYGISIVLWASLMYYGIGFKLKDTKLKK
jgi:hypothetical protein